MLNRYRKGYMGERDLVHKLHSLGYMVMRAPRSGRINLEQPDVIAIKNGKIIVIECKVRDEAFTVEKEQINELLQWVKIGGAQAYVAWKLPRKEWVFIRVDDVIENGGNVGKKFAEQKSITIDQL